MEILSERTPDEQLRTIARVLTQLKHQANAGFGGDASRRRPDARAAAPPVSTGPKFMWQVSDLPAAGAMHMDAALEELRRPNDAGIVVMSFHIALAENILDFAVKVEQGEPLAAPRWELAIGLTALADGRFGVATTLLDASVATYPAFAPLQLACGSVHGMLAMLPGGGQLTPRKPPPSGVTPFPERPFISPYDPANTRVRTLRTGSDMTRAKASRDNHLKKARTALQRVLDADPQEPEAALRLGHVRIQQGEDQDGARLLEPLVTRVDLPVRLYYLSRLFLADVVVRAGDLDRARTLWEEAIARVPSGQSAHVALAGAVRASGDQDQSSVLLRRMMNAPKKPDDPWIAYRFGQYLGARPADRDPAQGGAEVMLRVALAATCALVALAPVQEQRSRFRSTAQAVQVDVQVLDGKKPVAGLTAADFELFDSGVAQIIKAVTVEDVPVSVLMALDVSGSVKGEALAT